MSNLVFRDSFDDLRHWTGTGALDTINFYSAGPAVQAGVLTSKRSFFDVEKVSIRFYDTLGSQYLALSLADREILRFSGNSTYYTVLEEDVLTVSTMARSPGWHLLEIEIKTDYRIKVDGTTIATSTRDARQAFDVIISGGIWDDFEVSRVYADDYQGGTGTLDDLKIMDLEILDEGSMRYTVNPGYFYADNIEYYHFANMGVYEFTADPSGIVVGASGLPYIPGNPSFVVADEDISTGSGYIRTPFDRTYLVTWNQDPNNEDAYIPTISGAFDDRLVYEAGLTREIDTPIPVDSTKLVLSDEGGTAATVRSESSYIDYVKVGNNYQVFAEVLDKYNGPVSGVTVSWKRVGADDDISVVATGTTNSNGIATGTVVVTESESFHIYAEVNPTSQPRWIQVQVPVAQVTSSVFQLDDEDVFFDSQEGRAAVGQNIWAEQWGSNPGTATGSSFPYPTTHGQWEDEHGELERPPITNDYPVHEPSGWWNGYDFDDAYPSIVAAVGTVPTFMNPMFVARNGFWGQELISGSDIRGGSPTIPSGQVLNHNETYEIDRDYGATTGTYLDVKNASGEYDSVFYVFYQPGSEYSGSSTDPTGNYYFRGVAVYEEDLGQTNSQVQDIISGSRLQE